MNALSLREAPLAVDDHLFEPWTREEMVRGERMEVLPSSPDRVVMREGLSYVIETLAVSGYVVALNLLTRAGPSSNFATDVSVRREGKDPQTGRRYLEELAFVVVSEQEPRHVEWRMEDLSLRGVRRLFAVFVDEVKICEWSANDRCLVPLAMDSELIDPALAIPLPPRALFGSAADRSSVLLSARWAKGDPVLKRLMFAWGMRDIARRFLNARGIGLDAQQEATLDACRDADRLERWALASLTVSSVDELLDLP